MALEELNDKLAGTSTSRRTIVRTGAKLAYAAPLVAVTMKMNSSTANAQRISGPTDACFHSAGTGGGCKGACTSVGDGLGKPCSEICGDGKSTGACPVGQGGDNPCCNPGYCDPANYEYLGDKVVKYIGPGCVI